MKKFFYLPLIALALSACGGDNSQGAKAASQAATPAAQPAGKVVRVAVEPVYPPFVQQLPQGGFEGFDVALMNEIAKRQGFEVTYTPYIWSGIFDYLSKGDVDVVMGGVDISEEREAIVDFTEPYLENATVLLVQDSSPIKTAEQARGKKVAYQTGTTSMTDLRKLQGVEELDKTLGEDTAWKTVKRVLATDGTQVDAAIGQSATLNYYAKQYKDQNMRLITSPTFTAERVAFAVKDGNTELRDKLNKGLAQVKADGTLDKLKHEWLDNAHKHSENEKH